MPRSLLVEDDTGQAMALAQRLRASSYGVIVAFDVATASHLLQTETFDVILCDLFLPPESGLDLLDVVERAQLSTPFVPCPASVRTSSIGC